MSQIISNIGDYNQFATNTDHKQVICSRDTNNLRSGDWSKSYESCTVSSVPWREYIVQCIEYKYNDSVKVQELNVRCTVCKG